MNMKIGLMALGLVLVAAAPARAGDLEGSNALAGLMQRVLQTCTGAQAIVYRAGGSDRGEQALVDGRQQVAPMSRMIEPARTCQGPQPHEAEGLLLALDAATLVADRDTAVACGGTGLGGGPVAVSDRNGVPGLQCPGCTGPAGDVYQVSDWRDGLRLLYAGMHQGAGADLGQQDCNSDIRHALAISWGALFGGGCTGTACAGVRHLFRPGDRSTPSALLLELLGLPASPSVAFCNGAGAAPAPFPVPATHPLTDFLDRDPIRRPCTSNDQVCNLDGTLGLVLPIDPPSNRDEATLYPIVLCDVGQFRLQSTFRNGIVPQGFRCPNGKLTLFSKCFQPVKLAPEGFPLPVACLAHPFPVQGLFSNGMTHGGAYNLHLRDAENYYLSDQWGRPATGSFFRLHTTRTAAGPGGGCRLGGVNEQIACLAQASPCSVGLAGGLTGAGDQIPGVVALPVGGIEPALASVRRLETAATDPLAYPVAGRVMLNTLVGFDALTDVAEGVLAGCLSNQSIASNAATAAGLIPLTSAPSCVDFDERRCSGGGLFNVNACMKRLFNECPTIDQLAVAPLATDVGLTIQVSASASDPELDPIDYLWRADAGSFADPTAASTSYTCTTAGTHTLTLTVWDGRCDERTTIPITCH